MFPELYNTIREYREIYLHDVNTVLEIGSRNVNGSVKDHFKRVAYYGIDMEAGDGVDVVIDLEECFQSNKQGQLYMAHLRHMIQNTDVIICLETFEHMMSWFKVVRIIRQHLPTDSYFIVSTPTTGFPLHRYPKDYYRFMEDAYRDIIFKEFTILDLRTIHTEHGHPVLVAIGRK